MEYVQGEYTLASKVKLAQNIWSFTVECPEVAALARAGQFVHLRAPGFLLRRPISICEIHRNTGRIRLVFEKRGEGTAALAATKEGETVGMLAPLGNGFAPYEPGRTVVLVGGGIGVPPLLELAKEYGKDARAVLGFRSAEQVILADDFAGAGALTSICTEDGSVGEQGFVTAAVERALQTAPPDLLCACGPRPMLREMKRLALRCGVRCQLSLEERMACGVGACLGCACKTHREGQTQYLHVCKNGPVFEAEEVVFDE